MRNTLAGTTKGNSKSAKYYQTNRIAAKKKKEYDTQYHKSKERRIYRAALNKKNIKDGTYGNKDGLDKSHTKKGNMVDESQSKNRARNREKK